MRKAKSLETALLWLYLKGIYLAVKQKQRVVCKHDFALEAKVGERIRTGALKKTSGSASELMAFVVVFAVKKLNFTRW